MKLVSTTLKIVNKYRAREFSCPFSMVFGCSSKNKYQSIAMDEAFSMMEDMNEYVLVDVRTIEEYNDGHIPGAINIPNESITSAPSELDKEDTIFIYCRSGSRSKQASSKLVDLGYTKIYEIGGIIDYDGELE